MKEDRKIYIDFLKILSIVMVMFNHTGTDGFVLFAANPESSYSILYLFVSIFIQIAVPLFFMASGALLIDKEEPLKRIIKHRFFKYLVVLVVASLIQYLYICLYYKPQPFSISTFLTKVYTSKYAATYWYLYAYLAYILMLPFIRHLAKAMSDKDYLWMIALHALIMLLSVVDYLIWKGKKTHNTHFSFFIEKNYIFYPLMGYYIDRRMNSKHFSKKTILIFSIASIASVLTCCYLTLFKCRATGEWEASKCQTFFNTLTFIPAITIFISAKILFQKCKPNARICRVISLLGGTTFGIFLIENICRNETKGIFNALKPYIHTFPACWIWILAACALGAAVTVVLKLIPGIKKYL